MPPCYFPRCPRSHTRFDHAMHPTSRANLARQRNTSVVPARPHPRAALLLLASLVPALTPHAQSSNPRRTAHPRSGWRAVSGPCWRSTACARLPRRCCAPWRTPSRPRWNGAVAEPTTGRFACLGASPGRHGCYSSALPGSASTLSRASTRPHSRSGQATSPSAISSCARPANGWPASAPAGTSGAPPTAGWR